MVADVYLRTVATMDKLRETLRDEHSFLIQVRLQRTADPALRCRHWACQSSTKPYLLVQCTEPVLTGISSHPRLRC